MTSKFSSIISAAKRTFGIHSPSKVFAEIGEYLMLGLGDGVGDKAGNAVKAVSNVATAMSEAMTLDDVTVGYQVENGLLTAAEAFSGIVDKLHSLAQIVTSTEFRFPQISTGTVVPYKVRSVDSAAASEQSAALQQGVADQIEWIKEIWSELQGVRRLLESINRKQLVVDGDSITNYVRQKMRELERNYGGII